MTAAPSRSGDPRRGTDTGRDGMLVGTPHEIKIIGAVDSDVSRAHDDSASLSAQLTLSKQQRTRLSSDLNRCRKIADELKDENLQLASELARCHDSRTSELHHLQDALLEEQLRRAETAKLSTDLQVEIANVRQSCRDEQLQRLSLTEEVAQTRLKRGRQFEELSREIESLQAQYTKAIDDLQLAQEEKADEATRLSQMQRELRDARTDVKEKQMRIDLLSDRLSQIERPIASPDQQAELREENDLLWARLEGAKEQVELLSGKIVSDEVFKERDSLKVRVAELDDIVAELRCELAERTELSPALFRSVKSELHEKTETIKRLLQHGADSGGSHLDKIEAMKVEFEKKLAHESKRFEHQTRQSSLWESRVVKLEEQLVAEHAVSEGLRQKLDDVDSMECKECEDLQAEKQRVRDEALVVETILRSTVEELEVKLTSEAEGFAVKLFAQAEEFEAKFAGIANEIGASKTNVRSLENELVSLIFRPSPVDDDKVIALECKIGILSSQLEANVQEESQKSVLLKGQLEEMTNANKILQDRLEMVESESERFQSEFQTQVRLAGDTLMELEKVKDENERDVSALKGKLEAIPQTNPELVEQLTKLRQQLLDATSENALLKAARNMSRSTTEPRPTSPQSSQEVELLKKEIRAVKESAEMAVAQRNRLQNDLEKVLLQLKISEKGWKEQFVFCATREAALEKNLESLRRDNTSLQAKFSDLPKIVKESKKTRSDTKENKNNSDLLSEKQNLERQMAQVQAEEARQRRRVEELLDQLNVLSKRTPRSSKTSGVPLPMMVVVSVLASSFFTYFCTVLTF